MDSTEWFAFAATHPIQLSDSHLYLPPGVAGHLTPLLVHQKRLEGDLILWHLRPVHPLSDVVVWPIDYLPALGPQETGLYN